MSYRHVYLSDLIERIEDGAIIPRDPNNRDFQEFLAWEEAGGVLGEALDITATPQEKA